MIEGVWFFHNGEIGHLEQGAKENKAIVLIAEPSVNDWRGNKTYQLTIKKKIYESV